MDGNVHLAFCWAHMRRAFYEFYTSTKSPQALEVLTRVRAPYAIEAEIRGHSAEHRKQVRQARSRPIVDALLIWLQDHVRRVSTISNLADAIRYAVRHWPGLVVFLDDGRVEMDTNVVERAIRPHTITRKNALLAGSDGGARHWAIAMTLIQPAKLNGVNPMAWLTDVLECVISGETEANELHQLLPWNWVPSSALAIAPRLHNRPVSNTEPVSQRQPCRPGAAYLAMADDIDIPADREPATEGGRAHHSGRLLAWWRGHRLTGPRVSKGVALASAHVSGRDLAAA
jgi:hypothetical protein